MSDSVENENIGYVMPGRRNAFSIRYTRPGVDPIACLEHLKRVNEELSSLGCEVISLGSCYALEDVRKILLDRGPSAFLGLVHVQEDIVSRSEVSSAREKVKRRLESLSPAKELVIVDPYLFPKRLAGGREDYVNFLSDLIASTLAPNGAVVFVVNKASDSAIEQLVKAALEAKGVGANVRTVKTDWIHDRFWIADRKSGVVIGASLNGLGKRLFFMDGLQKRDVEHLCEELRRCGV